MLINYPFHFSPSTRGAIVHFCEPHGFFYHIYEVLFLNSNTLLDFVLPSHTFLVILFSLRLSSYFEAIPPLFASSPSHAQEYILPCMWIHSRACSHVACAGAAACDVKPDPFFSQADHQEWGLRLTVHRAPWRSHLPPFLSFFFFPSWWDDIIQGGRRMATRWKANNQKLWLCTVSM